MLRDSYETSHGIFNHDSEEGNSDPLALVRMHWSEDMITNGGLHQWMRRFRKKRIGDIFNISFKDFIEQESWVCELMYSVACEDDNAARAVEEEFQKKAAEALGGKNTL